MVIKVLYSQGFTGHRGPPIMQTEPIVTYVRVSTSGQGRSGLGIEAQRHTLAQFAQAEGFEVSRELRAITNNDLNRESTVVISSTIPSAKYSCSGSPDMF